MMQGTCHSVDDARKHPRHKKPTSYIIAFTGTVQSRQIQRDGKWIPGSRHLDGSGNWEGTECGVSFQEDENILNQVVWIVAQCWDYTENC